MENFNLKNEFSNYYFDQQRTIIQGT
jgi:hypothetical protein